MTRKVTKAERQEAIDRLREILKPGDTVYTIVKHVSRSGMLRHIELYVIKDNEPQRLSGWAADALGWRWTNDGVVVGGCGMDMGFHTVYELAATLFNHPISGNPDGYALKQRWL